MAKTPMILTTVHHQILLAIDSGMKTFQSNYPPALDLVSEGYCTWSRGTPNSWNLELTNFGVSAVCMIQRPDVIEGIALEKIDASVSRIVDEDGVLGFAVRYDDNKWLPLDSASNPLPSGFMTSPESVLLLFKMEQARIADECAQALDFRKLRMAV
jgi:hypothetical protein